jgi:hypothetical protein
MVEEKLRELELSLCERHLAALDAEPSGCRAAQVSPSSCCSLIDMVKAAEDRSDHNLGTSNLGG